MPPPDHKFLVSGICGQEEHDGGQQQQCFFLSAELPRACLCHCCVLSTMSERIHYGGIVSRTTACSSALIHLACRRPTGRGRHRALHQATSTELKVSTSERPSILCDSARYEKRRAPSSSQSSPQSVCRFTVQLSLCSDLRVAIESHSNRSCSIPK